MHERPRLSRDVISLLALEQTGGSLDLPPIAALGLPERVVQFGTGAFLRGFVEYFIDDANRQGRFNGSIVAVASSGTAARRDEILNEQDGLYTLAVQGMDGGAARQRYRVVASLSRALSARDDWDAVLELARDPEIDLVVSNTTEIGIALDDEDRFDGRPPKSFPAKLTRFLAERATCFGYDRRCGVIVLPCELIENNGGELGALIRELAVRWKLDPRFIGWLDESVVFCNTLVDRIVPGALPAEDAERLERVFGYRDGLATTCENYALFAIEGDDGLRARLGFPGEDSRIIVAPDIRPYRERKVRVLNGAHTLMVPAALAAGLETVRDVVTDAQFGRFIVRVIFDEIVPCLDVPDAEQFARDVMSRFANPYVRHALIDITLHQTAKMRVRVVPSIVAYAEQTQRAPALLATGFAAYLHYMRGDMQVERRASGLAVPEDVDGERIRAAWRDVDPHSDSSLADLSRRVLSDGELWGVDLALLPGFADIVAEQLVRIARRGVRSAIDVRSTEAVTT